MNLFKFLAVFVVLIIFQACENEPAQNNTDVIIDIDDDSVVDKPVVSTIRSEVSKDAVASYRVKTDDPLNDWYFKAAIFETGETFKYLMKFQFEEIRGEDTLRFPNTGVEIKPVIKKGPEKYSCIIGFLHPVDSSFKEYKKLYVKDDNLKLTTLVQYYTY